MIVLDLKKSDMKDNKEGGVSCEHLPERAIKHNVYASTVKTKQRPFG